MAVDIINLRELLAVATPGPWEEGVAGGMNVVHFDGDDIRGVLYIDGRTEYRRVVLAAFNALPALLDEVERLRGALRKLQDWALNKAPGCASEFSPATAATIAIICEDALDAARGTRG